MRSSLRVRLLCAGSAFSLLSGALVVLPPLPAAAADPLIPDKSVPVSSFAGKADALAGVPVSGVPAVAWPSAGSAVVDVPSALSRSAVPVTTIGGLPVTVSVVGTGGGTQAQVLAEAESAPSKVRVEILDRATSVKGRGALGLRVSRADGKTGPAKVNISIDYNGFKSGFGAGWADRLGLQLMPECGLGPISDSAASRGECVGVPLNVVNNARTGVISADVDLAAPLKTSGAGRIAGLSLADQAEDSSASTMSGSEPLVMMLTAGTDASGFGTFGKTDLKQSSFWNAGGSSGNFSYSYPMSAPAVPGGLVPSFGLSYSSQSVDGQTSNEQAQSGLVGEGWSLSGLSFVESTFRACSEDDDHPQTYVVTSSEACFRFPNYQLSFGGHSGELVTWQGNKWKLASDDLTVAEYVPAAGADGPYWKVTTADGTQYFFGRQRLPGWTAGARETQSLLTQPVWGNNSDEPCFSAVSFAASWCQTPYRFYLDYVVDVRGNSMSYWYDRFLNNAKTVAGTIPYARDAVLNHIEYGTRAGSEAVPTNTPARVDFENSDRCFTNCGDYASWEDTPKDLECYIGPCSTDGASFFTTKRLSKVTTKIWDGLQYRTVDEWKLGQSFPNNPQAGHKTLWLDDIEHTGHDISGNTKTLPKLQTAGVNMRSRADYDPNAGMQDHWRYRVSAILTGTGSQIEVSYGGVGAECTWPTVNVNYNHNSARCFQQWYVPKQAPASWTVWNKYVVDKVLQRDMAAGSPPVETSYEYRMDGAASKDKDGNVLPLVVWTYASGVWGTVKKAMSTWRGYPTVITRTGPAGGTQSVVKRLYYRGIDRDTGLDNNNHEQEFWRRATITTSTGYTVDDHQALAGQLREETVYDGAAEISKTVHGFAAMETAFGPIPSWQTPPERRSWMVLATGTDTYAKRADGSWRQAAIVHTYDAGSGALERTDDRGDVSTAADDTCTRYSYVSNAATNLVNVPVRTETVGVQCGTAPSYPNDLLSDTRIYYDGATVLTAVPSRGLPTKAEAVRKHNGSAAAVFDASETSYDLYGRPVAVKNALGHQTSMEYTHSGGGLLSKVDTYNPLGHKTTVNLNPARQVPLSVVDANGKTTRGEYDPLGRLVKLFKPGNTGATPDAEYGYSLTHTAPSYVSTKVLGPNGNQIVSYEILDGFLRPRQTQATAPDGKRAISDTQYDARGLAVKTSTFYNNASGPASALVTFADNAIDSQTRTVYDGAGRATASELWSQNVFKWKTSTAYFGDHTETTPPAGGTATATFFDVRGKTTELRQYQAATPTGSYLSTGYTYDRKGQLTKVTNPAGTQWLYEYDLLGRKTKTTDPDAGVSTNAYDHAGQLVSTMDARGQELFYEYDALGRKTRTRTTGPGGDGGTPPGDSTIKNPVSGRCLDPAGAGTANGTQIQLYDCGGEAWQQFVQQPDGSIKNPTSGRCLDAVLGGSSNGTKLQLYDCNGSGAQKFAQYPDGSIKNPVSGRCLDLDTSGGGTANGTKLQLWDCWGGTNQKFTTINTPWVTLTASTYDTVAKGQLTSTSRYNTPDTYTQTVNAYNDSYQPLSATMTAPGFGDSGTALTYTSTTTYKQNGAVSTQNLPAAGTLTAEKLTYAYSDNGPLTSLTSDANAGTTYLASAAYTFDGLPAQQILGSSGKQVKRVNTFDPATRRLSTSTTQTETSPGTFTTAFDDTYTYDPAGNITSAAGKTTGVADQQECFTHDYLRRLTEAWTQVSGTCTTPQKTGADPYWRKWTFDNTGNRLTQTDKNADGTTGTTWTSTIGAAGGVKPHQVSKVDATGPLAGTPTRTFTYDTAGNTTTRTTETGTAQTLTWDKENHLSKVEEGAGNTVASYLYDPAGARLIGTAKTATDTTTTLYLPDGTELEKSSSGGAILGQRYIGGIAVKNSTGHKWIIPNHQGTGTAQIDAVALSVNRRRSMPYGEPRGTQPSWLGTRGYVGGTKDTPTGLTHLGAREYDPTTGRFISVDPIMDLTDPQQWHPYAYSNSTPITSSDPSGLHNGPSDLGAGGLARAVTSSSSSVDNAWNRWKAGIKGFYKGYYVTGPKNLWKGLNTPVSEIFAGMKADYDKRRPFTPAREAALCAVTGICSYIEKIISTAKTGDPGAMGELSGELSFNLAVGAATDGAFRFLPGKGRPPATGAKGASGLDEIAAAYRANPANGVGGRRNVAVAQFDIDGLSGQLIGVSGKHHNPGTVGTPTSQHFNPGERPLDAEYQILENLASRLSPGAKGTVNLYSELRVCPSCSSVISQFQERFPGVTINVTTG